MKFRLLFILLSLIILPCSAQVRTWHDAMHTKNLKWLKSSQADSLVSTIIRAQLSHGGWPKNQNWLSSVNWKEIEDCKQSGYGETIDNNATTGELQFLANYLAANYDMQKNMDISTKAFLLGIDYLLEAQYDNGGWPQFYPQRSDLSDHYSCHITFNDDAMVNVLSLFQHIIKKDYPYSAIPIDSTRLNAIARAYQDGIECILKCQIRKNGILTVWCQQHDKDSLQPVKARAYELPSYSGAGETVGILMFLMNVPAQTNEIRNAVTSAIYWLEEHKINGIRVRRFINGDGKPDLSVINDPDAPCIWARFYSLENEKPFFCDRDGIPKTHLNEIGYERRNGYSWLNYSPQRAIDYYHNVYLKDNL